MRGPFTFALCAVAFVGMFLIDAGSSRGAIILIDRVQKASSTASNGSGTVSDTQPDQLLGTTLGSSTLTSNSETPNTLTKGHSSVNSDVGQGNDNGLNHLIDVLISASSTVGVSGGVGSGFAEVVITYQFTSAVQLKQTGFLNGPGGYDLFIKNSANVAVYVDPAISSTLSFAPDTYTFDFQVVRSNNVGTSASELAQVTMTVLPEPASAGIIVGAIAMMGIRRSSRRRSGKLRNHDRALRRR